MSLIARATGGTKHPPIPEGSYAAVCVGLYDVGTQHMEYEGREKDSAQVVIVWELPGETIEIDGEPKARTISKTYTNSLHERSGLRKDLKSWRGREFTPEELEGFNLVNILGAGCMIQIIHRETKNGTYANISSIMSLPKGMPKPVTTTPLRTFDVDTAAADDLLQLPEWIQEKVKASLEWQARESIPGDGDPQWSDLPDDDSDLPF